MSKAPHDTEPAMTHTLKKRALGDSGLDIAPLVFGGNVFGWTADRSTSFSLLDAFVEAGFDAIDTADATPEPS